MTPFVTPSRPMRPSLSGVVPRHHPDDPQTGAAPQRSINLKTRPCTVCLHRVLRKDLERLINGIPRNPRGRGEADPKAFAAGGTLTLGTLPVWRWVRPCIICDTAGRSSGVCLQRCGAEAWPHALDERFHRSLICFIWLREVACPGRWCRTQRGADFPLPVV